MRTVRYAFLAVLGLVLIIVALANRGAVTLNALPAELAGIVGVAPSVSLPLFIVILGSIVFGILIGFVWEWLREHKHRAEAAAQRRERQRLEREMKDLKGNDPADEDDVLGLLSDAEAAR